MPAGRPTIPTKLKLISGTYRADQANLAEPTPRAGKPLQPANLSPAAKRAWKKFATLLDDIGVLTTSDGAALASLCEATADLAAARKALVGRRTPLRPSRRPNRPYHGVITITGIGDHLRPEWLITITGTRT